MKKIFLALTLIAGLAPRPAQAIDPELQNILKAYGAFAAVVAATFAATFTPVKLAEKNIFPFNTTTKEYQTWLLAGVCGLGSGLLTKLLIQDNGVSFTLGAISFILTFVAANGYGCDNLYNATRNNDPLLPNILSKLANPASQLIYALDNQNHPEQSIETLIEHSPNINFIINSSALMAAIAHHHSPYIIQRIIDKGADVNTSQNNNGDTPLMQAINSTPQVTPEIFRQQLEILLTAGADPNIQNIAGQNAFDLANNLPGEHATIFTEMVYSKDEIEKLLPFLRAFEIQKQ